MFRFTIRDVLWLTVVVALAVGWWADRGWLAGRLKRMEGIAHTLLDHLEYELQRDGQPATVVLRMPDGSRWPE